MEDKTIADSRYRLGMAYLRDVRLDRERPSMRDVAEVIKKPHSFIGKTENSNRRLDILEAVDYCKSIGADAHLLIGILQGSDYTIKYPKRGTGALTV